MKIGVDARPVEVSQRAGIQNYVYHVLKNIHNEDVCLFFKSSDKSGIFKDKINFSNQVIELPFYRWKMEQLWERYLLPRKVNRCKIDVFWGGRFYVPIGLKCRAVATIHDMAFLKIPGLTSKEVVKYFDSLIRQSIKSASSFIAISETTKNDFCELYNVSEDKVDVIYNGYDPYFQQAMSNEEVESTLEKFGIAQSYILFIGTLEPRKNLRNLCKAYLNSQAFKENVSLVICGKMGWLQDQFMQEIRPYIESKKIIVTGYVTDNELLCLYKRSLFFAFPSLYEGFGIPILEAMAAGVPVLTSNNSSMKELFMDCTEQIDPYDIESISNGINRLLSKDLRSSLAIKGREKASNFSWSKCALEHVNHFRTFR
jgi:glycosyltransferase involved in cell wall biosynthesis